MTPANVRDLTKLKVGMLTVASFAGTISGFALWNCICECGKSSVVRSLNLVRTSPTRSCGCIKKNQKTRLRHGRTRTPEHTAWSAMIQRCTDANYHWWPHYGGRGIKICRRWMLFENFFADMGVRPTAHHSLDRINNEGNYTARNCRWATIQQQAENRRTNRYLTFEGRRLTVTQWAREIGLSKSAMFLRVSKGWSVQRTINTPPMKRKDRS